jgi:hypothetical protein
VTIPTFTLTGCALDLLDTTDPAALDSIVLTPNTRGQTVSILGVLYRPEPITVNLDAAGKINGDNGIELLANDDSLDLDSPLQWQVQIVTTAGFVWQPKPFWFEAGAADETVLLADVSPAPLMAAQGVSRGPRGVDDLRFTAQGGDLLLEFMFRGERVGDAVNLSVPDLDGGNPYATSESLIDGGLI